MLHPFPVCYGREQEVALILHYLVFMYDTSHEK